MHAALGENAVLWSSDRGSIPLASTKQESYEPLTVMVVGRVILITKKLPV